MASRRVLKLWGKTPDDPSQLQNGWYHPVLFHLLDVGNVAKILWERWIPPRTKERIAQGLHLTIPEAGAAVVLLTALHDLGKASPAFQKKCEPLRQALDLTCVDAQNSPHNFITAKLLPDLLQSGAFGWKTEFALSRTLAKITGAHHGSFPSDAELSSSLDYGEKTCGAGEWRELQLETAQEVVRLLCPDAPPLTMTLTDIERKNVGMVPFLAGLISVADWVGSSKAHFSIDGPPPYDADDYAAKSQTRAQDALEKFGWLQEREAAPAKSFKDLFGFDPNPLQKATDTLTEGVTDPYLLLIEAAMGGGKTEAALWAVDRAIRNGLASGFYLALPTQAMSNAMLPRLTKNGNGYLDRASLGERLNLQLVHGNALLSDAFDTLRMEARRNVPDEAEEQDSRVLAEDWFTGKKRTLLAPFGVGTIDQTLLGVLQTRHWFVRLFGLAGKAIIFDEIHAYDVYMSALLENLIRWLRELDCTVILLSATLPSAKRDALITAWRGKSVKPLEDKEDYPRLTFLPSEGEASIVTPKENSSSGDATSLPPPVQLHWQPTDPAGLPSIIREALPNGGCYAVICNTVARAQAVYDVLAESLGKEGWEISLFHARTPFVWRQETEKEILKRFGKNPDDPADVANARNRPSRAVLVATQVAEQSIDLDFDGMATDLAPTDLVLQRMGRLWRHEKRPKEQRHGVSGPRLTILCDQDPANPNAPPTFAPGSKSVYEPYVLLRSYLTLRSVQEIRLPEDIPTLVQATYEPFDYSRRSDAFCERLQEAKQKTDDKQAKDSNMAKGVSIPRPCAPEDLWDRLCEELWDDEDPKIHQSLRASTRLGDPSITVVCLGADLGKDVKPDKDGKFPLKAVRHLREWSLSLSQRHLYRALCKLPVPTAWEKNAHLRHCRPLEFANSMVGVGEYTLRLTPERGLEILKEPQLDNETDAEAE